jgi:hypothetical protein
MTSLHHDWWQALLWLQWLHVSCHNNLLICTDYSTMLALPFISAQRSLWHLVVWILCSLKPQVITCSSCQSLRRLPIVLFYHYRHSRTVYQRAVYLNWVYHVRFSSKAWEAKASCPWTTKAKWRCWSCPVTDAQIGRVWEKVQQGTRSHWYTLDEIAWGKCLCRSSCSGTYFAAEIYITANTTTRSREHHRCLPPQPWSHSSYSLTTHQSILEFYSIMNTMTKSKQKPTDFIPKTVRQAQAMLPTISKNLHDIETGCPIWRGNDWQRKLKKRRKRWSQIQQK